MKKWLLGPAAVEVKKIQEPLHYWYTYDETTTYRNARHSDAPALASYLANYLTIR